MTTARKVLLITATILVVAGVAIAGSALAFAGGFAGLSNDDRDWVQRDFELAPEETAALASIEVADDDEEIRVEGYEGDSVRVMYYENQRRGVSIQHEGTSLSVVGDSADEPFRIGFFVSYPEDHATLVLVPYTYAGDLNASTESAHVSVARFAHAGNVRISANSGWATANSVGARSLTIENESGGVQCSAVTVDEGVEARVDNGDVVLDSVLAGAIHTSCQNGSASLSAVTARQAIEAEAQNGTVDLHGCDAPETTVETDNGDATLTLPGSRFDYMIDARAENGAVTGVAEANRSGADRLVTARAVNGDVELSFDARDLSDEGAIYQGEALETVLSNAKTYGFPIDGVPGEATR